MAKSSLTKSPQVLYQASLEHIDALILLRSEKRWSLAVYVSGLAVECILQAVALRSGEKSDAKHDLRKWLAKCPRRFQATIEEETADSWSFLTVAWANPIRYLSHDGLLGHLRALKLNHGIKQGKNGSEAILKVNTDRVIAAARAVHGKGAVLWQPASSPK